MDSGVFAQFVGLGGGLLLLTGVLIVWRRSLASNVRLLMLQGVALAGLVAVIGVHARSVELLSLAVLVLVLKGVVLPTVLARTISRGGAAPVESPLNWRTS
jgi:hydrogenase-4 component E